MPTLSQLRHVPFLSHNVHLRELYLNDNRIVDVKGVLNNLKSLKILLLHNNQLEKLDVVVHEMQHMMCLRTFSRYFNLTAIHVIIYIKSNNILVKKIARKTLLITHANYNK